MPVRVAVVILGILGVQLAITPSPVLAVDRATPARHAQVTVTVTQPEAAAATSAPRAKTNKHDDPPMQVYIVRSSRPGCQPNCPEWIAAQGKIEAGTLQKFKAVLNQTAKRNLPVYLHSGGGSVSEALAIGRLLRAKGLDTVVAQTLFMPCAPTDAICRKSEPDGVLRGTPHFFGTCASSCTFVLAGGKRRYVGSLARVGVHQIKTFQTFRQVRRTFRVMRLPNGSVTRRLLSEETLSRKTVVTKTGKDMYDSMEKYFAEMGVGKDIVPMFQSTPNAQVRWLTDKELELTQLATDRKNGVVLNAETMMQMRGTVPDGKSSGTQAVPAANASTCQRFGGVAIGCVPSQ